MKFCGEAFVAEIRMATSPSSVDDTVYALPLPGVEEDCEG